MLLLVRPISVLIQLNFHPVAKRHRSPVGVAVGFGHLFIDPFRIGSMRGKAISHVSAIFMSRISASRLLLLVTGRLLQLLFANVLAASPFLLGAISPNQPARRAAAAAYPFSLAPRLVRY